MLQWIKTRVRQHQVGLVFRHGDFVGALAPGRYWILRAFGRTVEIVDVRQTIFAHELIDMMLDNVELREMVEVVDLTDTQRAFVWKDGRLGWILGAGRHVFWKRPYLSLIHI